MDQITDPIQSELANLNLDLDAKIPAKKMDNNLLIVTRNIRAFEYLTKKWESSVVDSPKRDFFSVF